MSAQQRTLVVVRHAKAEQAGATDAERELADRGYPDARDAGAWLAARGVRPDHALVSAATRARQTWEQLREGAGWDLEPELDQGLYAADTDAALDLLRLVDDRHTSVVVVGHNPTMASLAVTLDDGEGDAEAGSRLAEDFPTSAVAVFTCGAWADLAPGAATLAAYHVGRG